MADKLLTWEQKVEQGLPLSPLEKVKYDATRLTLKRVAEQKEAEALRQAEALPVLVKEKSPQNSKKG